MLAYTLCSQLGCLCAWGRQGIGLCISWSRARMDDLGLCPVRVAGYIKQCLQLMGSA